MDAEQERKDKAAFAAFLSQQPDSPNAAFDAALLVYPGNPGKALHCSRYWLFDPFVIEERARIASETIGETPEIVKKYISRKARMLIESPAIAARDRIAALELLGKIHGVVADENPEGENDKLPSEPTYKVVKQ